MGDMVKSFREERHINKEFFTGIDPQFYEPVYTHYVPSDELNDLVVTLLHERRPNWHIHRSGVWSHVMPAVHDDAIDLPTQGWKIHVSATEGNCRDILVKVARIALDAGLQFKFANDVNTLKLMTSKRWPRGGSGKFITLYPVNEAVFRELIEAAYLLLKDDVGSYILSDQRYKDCRCLYYRYGGIIQVNRLDYMGRKRAVLTAPDGERVADDRAPYFEVPHWVADPFPRDDVDQDEMTLNDGRFLVKSALAFSNTGGVYLATDAVTGADVVVKEARPYVELANNGHDATTRLMQEERALRFLDGAGVTPAVITSFWDWENYYLVIEYLDAFDIREVMLKHTPLLKVKPTVQESKEFYGICKKIFINLLTAVNTIHEKGMVFGDLSPTNIFVDKTTMAVCLIDLEAAFRPGIDEAHDIYTPGFRAEYKGRKKQGSVKDDLYAVGAIMMYSMFPIVALAYVREDIFSAVMPRLIADIGWSRTPLLYVVTELCAGRMSCLEATSLIKTDVDIDSPYAAALPMRAFPLTETCKSMAAFINRNYRDDPAYTLFPADPFASESGRSSFGFGSAGVIHALTACGFDVPEAAMTRYRADLDAINPRELAPGFLTGASGIAMASFAVGDAERGSRFMAYANGSALRLSHHSLYYGMAGIGIANLVAYRSAGEASYLIAAIGLAEKLASTAVECERGLHWEDDGGVRIGLGYGQSGVALFFLRLSQVLNVPRWRELGDRALNYDLSFAFELEAGVATFGSSPEEDKTYEHYIEQGTAGIAKVAIRYGRWDQIDRLLLDTHRKYAGFPGLIYGLAGFLDVMVDAHIYSGEPKYLEMAERPLAGLADLYIFETKDGLATPGDNLFRISCDFATGVAGVMRTLHRRSKLLPDELCLDEIDGLQVRPLAEAHMATDSLRHQSA
jgi:tRNA A-37 threonylcarbamoyl transferase component Bud32